MTQLLVHDEGGGGGGGPTGSPLKATAMHIWLSSAPCRQTQGQ